MAQGLLQLYHRILFSVRRMLELALAVHGRYFGLHLELRFKHSVLDHGVKCYVAYAD